MSKSFKNLKFQKYDQFSNFVFIAGEQTDPDNYEKIKSMYDKLSNKFETYLPVYHNEQYNYCTIRFQKYSIKQKLEEGATYNLEYSAHAVTKGDMKYVNIYAKNVKLNTKAVEFDRGEELDV